MNYQLRSFLCLDSLCDWRSNYVSHFAALPLLEMFAKFKSIGLNYISVTDREFSSRLTPYPPYRNLPDRYLRTDLGDFARSSSSFGEREYSGGRSGDRCRGREGGGF